MFHRRGVSSDRLSRVASGIALACLLFACGLTQIAFAQSRVREQTSLRLIPEDAGYYSASFRLREQFETFTRSKAFARLCDLPLIKTGLEELKQSFEEGFVGASADSDDDDEEEAKEKKKKEKKVGGNGDSDAADAGEEGNDGQEMLRQFYAFWSDPATKKVTDVVLDALSHEVFLYGDKNTVEFLRALKKWNIEMYKLEMTFPGARKGSTEMQLQPLLDHLDTLPVPAFVLGLKTTNPEGVTEQIAALETWLREALSEYPKVLAGLRREKVEGNEFLTLTLKGDQIPWKELLEEGNDDDDDDNDDDDAADDNKPSREIVELLSKKLKDRSLTLTLGVAEGYVLASFGEKKSQLLRMFEKGRKLSDRPEFKPLIKFPDSFFTGINYLSTDLNLQVQEYSDSSEYLKNGINGFGPLLGIAEEEREKLIKDIQEITNEATALGPKPGAIVGWSYQTPRGYEGYWYDFGGGNKSLDSSKPLSIVGHVGKSPLVVVATRYKNQLATFQFAAKSLAVIAGHLDTIATPHIPPPYGLFYSRLKEEFEPVVKEYYKITSEQLIPALADGQSAFVLESQPLKINQLPAPQAGPLPFPLPALVYGVTDANLLQKACGGYFDLLQQSATILNRVFPEQVPALVIPPPAERKVGEMRLFVYPVTGAEGSKDEIAATAGLGKDFSVLSFSPAQARYLLSDQTLASSGVLKRAEKPAARVWAVNVAGIAQMLSPWIDFAFEMHPEQAAQAAEDPEEVAKTIKGVLEFISCWRGAAGIQYVEDGALVHHYEAQFEDVK